MFRVSLLLLFVIMYSTGCMKSADEPKKLQAFYPGDLLMVDYVEIYDGSTGEKKIYSNKEQIQEWLKTIKDIAFVPDADQSKKDGSLYSVSLFEGEDKKLSFTTNLVGETYYITDQALTESIKHFFENN